MHEFKFIPSHNLHAYTPDMKNEKKIEQNAQLKLKIEGPQGFSLQLPTFQIINLFFLFPQWEMYFLEIISIYCMYFKIKWKLKKPHIISKVELPHEVINLFYRTNNNHTIFY